MYIISITGHAKTVLFHEPIAADTSLQINISAISIQQVSMLINNEFSVWWNKRSAHNNILPSGCHGSVTAVMDFTVDNQGLVLTKTSSAFSALML